MRKLIFILWLLPQLLAAQNKEADSLLRVLKAAKTDTQRVNLYNELSGLYFDQQTAKGFDYIDKAITLSRKINYLTGEGDAYYNRGKIFSNLAKPDSAKVNIEKAIATYKKINAPANMAAALIEYGLLIRVQGADAKAITYFQQAAELYEKINDLNGSAYTFAILANNYNQLHLFDKAIASYQKSYELRIKIKDEGLAAQSLAGIGLTYRNKQIFARNNDNFVLAIKYLFKARTVFLRTGPALRIALIDKEIGVTYLQQEDNKNALIYFLEAEQQFSKLDTRRELAALYNGIGKAYLNLKQYPKAKIYLEKGLAAAIAEKFQQHIMEAYERLYYYYKDLGDPKMALLYHEKFVVEKDSLISKTNFDKLSELSTKYETQKKEQEIKLLNKENTIQKLSITGRNKTIGIIAGLFLVSGIIAALLFYRSKLKQKALQLKQQDILTKAIVDAEENERTRIASDLHDGVGQLFSAVKMNLNGLFERITIAREEDRFLAENTLALVDESCKEVRAISHQMMPNMLLRSGIASDLKSFIEKIDADSLKVTLEATGFKNKLESNVETMLYRIIQETINNVIKHAKATRLEIILNRDTKGMSAKITDNGIGFNTNDRAIFTGIGLKNIATRVEYLKGTVRYISEAGRGTVVIIEVPVS